MKATAIFAEWPLGLNSSPSPRRIFGFHLLNPVRKIYGGLDSSPGGKAEKVLAVGVLGLEDGHLGQDKALPDEGRQPFGLQRFYNLVTGVTGISRMAKNGVVAVLLPGTAFYLGLKYPDVAMMRKQGVCFALATDYNPGSSPTTNLPFMMSLGCLQMGMTLPEAFAAATYGGANALGLHDSEGALLIGKKPKIALFNQPSYKALISQFAGVGSCRLLL